VLRSLVLPDPALRDHEKAEVANDRICPPPDLVYPPPARAEDVVRYLKASTQLADEQIARLVVASRKSIADNLEKVEKALQEKNYENLALAAHTLKGTLAQCGLAGWAEKAQELHYNAQHNRDFPFSGLLETLKTGMRELLAGGEGSTTQGTAFS
jgi:HPt (histidine-containing phosphotransfer) domain-containing protein